MSLNGFCSKILSCEELMHAYISVKVKTEVYNWMCVNGCENGFSRLEKINAEVEKTGKSLGKPVTSTELMKVLPRANLI